MHYSDVRTILVLGDSISKGVIFDEDKQRHSFSKERFVDRIAGCIRPQIVDCSKFGATTAYGLKLVRTKLEEASPELVFIEYGSNDCDHAWDEVAEHPDKPHGPKLALDEYMRNLRQLIASVRNAGALPVMTNLLPLAVDRYFAWFTHGDNETAKRTMRWLEDLRNVYWWQEMYSYAAERTAREARVPVLDIRRAFLSAGDYHKLLCRDGIHPNEQGHAVLFDTLMNYIRMSAASWIDRSQASADTTNE